MLKSELIETAITQYRTYAETDPKLREQVDKAIDAIEDETIHAGMRRSANGKTTYYTLVNVPNRSQTYIICWFIDHKRPATAYIYIIKQL